MKNTPFKTYGFNYECDGKNYALDVVAESAESAMRRVAAMSNSTFVGALIEGLDATSPIPSSGDCHPKARAGRAYE